MDLIISGFVLIIIDYIYLSLTGHTFKNMVKTIQKAPVIVRYNGAVASYILILLGLYFFILKQKKHPKEAALLGFIIYGVFDAVNYALFSKYDLKIGIMDAIWGGILFYITTHLTYTISNYFSLLYNKN